MSFLHINTSAINWGRKSDDQVVDILAGKPKNAFLVREGEDGYFVLSTFHGSKVGSKAVLDYSFFESTVQVSTFKATKKIKHRICPACNRSATFVARRAPIEGARPKKIYPSILDPDKSRNNFHV